MRELIVAALLAIAAVILNMVRPQLVSRVTLPERGSERRLCPSLPPPRTRQRQSPGRERRAAPWLPPASARFSPRPGFEGKVDEVERDDVAQRRMARVVIGNHRLREREPSPRFAMPSARTISIIWTARRGWQPVRPLVSAGRLALDVEISANTRSSGVLGQSVRLLYSATTFLGRSLRTRVVHCGQVFE